MVWKILLIVGAVILLIVIISFIYMLKVSTKEGPAGQEERRRKERTEHPDHATIHWENYGYDQNGKKRF